MEQFSLYKLRIAVWLLLVLAYVPCYGWQASEESMAQETISRADTLLHHLPSRLNRALRKMEQSRSIPPRQRVDLLNDLLQQSHRKVDVFTSLQGTLEELLIHSDNFRVRTRSNVERLLVRMSSYRRIALEKIDELERELISTENQVQRSLRQELEHSLTTYRKTKTSTELTYDPVDSLVGALALEEQSTSWSAVDTSRSEETSSSDTYLFDRSLSSSQESSGASIINEVSSELAAVIRWGLRHVLAGYYWLRDTLHATTITSLDYLQRLRTWYVSKPLERTITVEQQHNPYQEEVTVKERHLVRAWALYKVSSWWVRTRNALTRMRREASVIARTLMSDIQRGIRTAGDSVRSVGTYVGTVPATVGRYGSTLQRTITGVLCSAIDTIHGVAVRARHGIILAGRGVFAGVRGVCAAVYAACRAVGRGVYSVTASIARTVCNGTCTVKKGPLQGSRWSGAQAVYAARTMAQKITDGCGTVAATTAAAARGAKAAAENVGCCVKRCATAVTSRLLAVGKSSAQSAARVGSTIATGTKSMMQRVGVVLTNCLHAVINGLRHVLCLLKAAITRVARATAGTIHAMGRKVSGGCTTLATQTAAVGRRAVNGTVCAGRSVTSGISGVAQRTCSVVKTAVSASVAVAHRTANGCCVLAEKTKEVAIESAQCIPRGFTSFKCGVVRIADRVASATRGFFGKIMAGGRTVAAHMISFGKRIGGFFGAGAKRTVTSAQSTAALCIQYATAAGQAVATHTRVAAQAAVNSCSRLAANGKKVAQQVGSTVQSGWFQTRGAAATGAQKITVGAQHMGSTVCSGAQKVMSSAQQSASVAVSCVAAAGASGYQTAREMGLSALAIVSEWSNRLKAMLVAGLHRIRESVTCVYTIIQTKAQQWWRPKYVVPAAVSSDEIAQVAQKHKVSSQQVHLESPEDIVGATQATPVVRPQNRIVSFFVHAWHTVQALWYRFMHAAMSFAKRGWHVVSHDLFMKSVEKAKKGMQKGALWFGSAVDTTQRASAKVVQRGVAAGTRGWHTVKDATKHAVHKVKERLPWIGSTHRGVNNTSPTKMAPCQPVSSATPSRQTPMKKTSSLSGVHTAS